ncbi:ArsR family transcriptional regulator [Halobacteriales archaeon QS_8_69_26]|nr:MAG: ArsR family transcriptional regulator [Halobacteriales archaeon QS_8_69_26]
MTDADTPEARRRIADRIADDPGIHFNALVRALDLAPGQVQYHVRELLSTDRVVAESLYGRTHYYPPDVDPRTRRALAVLRRETAADVAAVLAVEGPARPAAVAEDLGIARSTLEYHLDRMESVGLVEKRRDERGRVTLALPRPAETADLLDGTDPSLPARMADRFERLVDGLLSE